MPEKGMPYGAGSTRHMTSSHYQAIADTMRDEFIRADGHPEIQATVVGTARRLATRMAAGNPRFSIGQFLDAITTAPDGSLL